MKLSVGTCFEPLKGTQRKLKPEGTVGWGDSQIQIRDEFVMSLSDLFVS